MSSASPAVAAPTGAAAPAALDDMMLAMDVVDTLRHREQLVERELDDDLREEQLVERIRALYKSQGIEVSDSIIAQGVKALKESRFVYTPLAPSYRRSLATLWVKRGSYGKWTAGVLAAVAVALGVYQYTVVGPRNRAAEAVRIELSDTLPRQLTAGHQAVASEAWVPEIRERSDAILARGRAALERGNAADARASVGELDRLLASLRQVYVLRIAGRPEDQTGFWREHPSFQGRAYFVVVDAVDSQNNPVQLSIRNDETNLVELVSRFAVRVPIETFNAVRNDKARNGIVQNMRMAEKRRGFLEPEFRMEALEGRLTQW